VRNYEIGVFCVHYSVYSKFPVMRPLVLDGQCFIRTTGRFMRVEHNAESSCWSFMHYETKLQSKLEVDGTIFLQAQITRSAN